MSDNSSVGKEEKMIEETKNYNSFSYYTQNVREVLFLGLQRESIYITTVET